MESSNTKRIVAKLDISRPLREKNLPSHSYGLAKCAAGRDEGVRQYAAETMGQLGSEARLGLKTMTGKIGERTVQVLV